MRFTIIASLLLSTSTKVLADRWICHGSGTIGNISYAKTIRHEVCDRMSGQYPFRRSFRTFCYEVPNADPDAPHTIALKLGSQVRDGVDGFEVAHDYCFAKLGRLMAVCALGSSYDDWDMIFRYAARCVCNYLTFRI